MNNAPRDPASTRWGTAAAGDPRAEREIDELRMVLTEASMTATEIENEVTWLRNLRGTTAVCNSEVSATQWDGEKLVPVRDRFTGLDLVAGTELKPGPDA